MSNRVVFSVALALAGAGCATGAPAPVDFRTGAGPEARAGAPRAAPISMHGAQESTAAIAPRPHPEAPEPDWAEGPGVPLSAFALRPEEAHPYDPAGGDRAHRVAAGETLYTIAAQRQIPLRALIDENRLAAPFALEVGQMLALPPPRVHRVRAGETLSSIGRHYNVDLRSLALMNRLRAPYALAPGDALVLPALARPVAAAPPPPSAQSPAPARAAPPAPAAPGTGVFAWPLRGEVVTRFGPLPDGRRSDGVEIAAAVGAPIQAVADGVVVYAGGDLPAYGQLVLVRHANGYVSAYGYAGRIMARLGQQVRRGEAIAEVGRAPEGAARLLLQLRRGAEPTDPLALLPAV